MFLMRGRFNVHDFFLKKQVCGRNLMAINARDVYAYEPYNYVTLLQELYFKGVFKKWLV